MNIAHQLIPSTPPTTHRWKQLHTGKIPFMKPNEAKQTGSENMKLFKRAF